MGYIKVLKVHQDMWQQRHGLGVFLYKALMVHNDAHFYLYTSTVHTNSWIESGSDCVQITLTFVWYGEFPFLVICLFGKLYTTSAKKDLRCVPCTLHLLIGLTKVLPAIYLHCTQYYNSSVMGLFPLCILWLYILRNLSPPWNVSSNL